MWDPIASSNKSLVDSSPKDEVPDSVVKDGLKYFEILRRELPKAKETSPTSPRPRSPINQRTFTPL